MSRKTVGDTVGKGWWKMNNLIVTFAMVLFMMKLLAFQMDLIMLQ